MIKYMFLFFRSAYTYSFAAKNKAPEGLYSWNMERYTPLIAAHILYQDSNQIVRIKEINELQKTTNFCANRHQWQTPLVALYIQWQVDTLFPTSTTWKRSHGYH